MKEKLKKLMDLNQVSSIKIHSVSPADLEEAVLELAQNQADLEEAIVELAELLTEVERNG